MTNRRSNLWALVLLFAILVAGLLAATWLDLRELSQQSLQRQVASFDSIITGVRAFYSTDVVGRILSAHTAVPTAHYLKVHGGIPIPATFSLALGNIVDRHQNAIHYRFVSDFPFKGRPPHELDAFERAALASLRRNPKQQISQVSWHGLTNEVRLVTPIIMEPACIGCHNSDPDSPKRNWKVGDVRGIQELSITQPIATNAFSFNYLLIYFGFASLLAIVVVVLQRRQTATIARVNDELARSNGTLESVAQRVSRYLSPQVYESIFSGRTESTIHTKRKKLTIFFSDIKDFTLTSERLQPEELTRLLNEYFTEMSRIAFAHGGTVDKFVGDAILVFFGDPETKGVAEDALACLRMAVAMQRRLEGLNRKWRAEGLEDPVLVRMGINTGYCDVGNFGSVDRMDYTVIGAEANLAARLESAARPGTIIVSYETYALIREHVRAHALTPIRAKGINREVVPYVIDGIHEGGDEPRVYTERADGLDLYVDLDAVGDDEAQRLRVLLAEVSAALERRNGSA